MQLGLLSTTGDHRVGLTPETVNKLTGQGHEVMIERGAGASAFFADDLYEAAGASLGSREEVLARGGVLVSVLPPSREELKGLKAGTTVIALFNPLVETELAAYVKELDIHAFSMDRIPRTTIAQSMDVLSSMASLAGYKSVITAADRLPGYFPMLMTAAGTIPPARVLILGAGVAGLQAIATAKRLGAVVEAFDVRTAVKEEVESLGGRFIEVEGAREDQAAGGYAVTQTEEYQRKQKELIHAHAAKADVVITTAQIPGRKAPLLIEAATVAAMKPGSVIIDLAASTGGNCALTEDGKTVVKHGVTLVGETDFPSQMAVHASKLFSNNVNNFFQYIFDAETGQFDPENEIVKGTQIA